MQLLDAAQPCRRVRERLAAALAAVLVAACASSPPASPAATESAPQAPAATAGGTPAGALAAPPVAAPPAPAPLPRLDPDLLFAPSAVADPTLSPDGRLVAWRLPETPGAVRVRAVDGAGAGIAVAAAGEAGEVVALSWGAGGRRLWVARRTDGGATLEAVELTAALPLDPSAGDAAGAVGGGVEVASTRLLFGSPEGELTLPAVVAGEPERALVGVRRPAADEHLLLAVSAAGGEADELARGGGDVERWLVDGGGEPRAAVLHGLDGSWRLAPVAGGRVGHPLLACTADESCRALALHPDGRRLALATDRAGGERVELVFLDLGDGGVERVGGVAGDPRDLGGALFAADGALLATWPAGEPFRVDPRDLAFAAGWERLAQALPAGGVELLAASADRRRLLASADAAGVVLLLDLDRAEARELLRLRPAAASSRHAIRRPFRYLARDGLSIPAVLTLPPSGEVSGPLAAVLLPPDDPWRPRRGGWQPLVELLADRGYAVLQPSPRGSAGFGRAFRAAGDRQWGGAMVDDLADGVRWLADEGIADPERVAIVGFGWGGYAAVASLAFTPDLYAAGVAVDGPVDLEALVADAADPLRAAVLRRRVGDPAVLEQRQRLRRHSPLAHAGAIRAPLLRIDLEGGPWSDLDGSERLLEVLRGLGRPVEAFTVVGTAAGDGAVRLEGAAGVAVAAEVERFLALHLDSPASR